MKTLAITADEFSWLARNLSKLVVATTEESKTKELIKKLAFRFSNDSFQMDNKQRLNIPVNRNELRIMQNLLSNQRLILLKVIENYSEEPVKFAKYIKQAEAKFQLLSGTLEKVEAGLK